MSEDKIVREVETSDGAVERETVHRHERPASGRMMARQVIWYIIDIIVVLIALRIILQLLGANQGNGFVDFIYGISGFFAAPFFGMFNYHPSYGASYFEVGSLVAIIVYLLIGWGLSALFSLGDRDAEV